MFMQNTLPCEIYEFVSSMNRDLPAPCVICLFSVRRYRGECVYPTVAEFSSDRQFSHTRRKAMEMSVTRRLDTINACRGHISVRLSQSNVRCARGHECILNNPVPWILKTTASQHSHEGRRTSSWRKELQVKRLFAWRKFEFLSASRTVYYLELTPSIMFLAPSPFNYS